MRDMMDSCVNGVIELIEDQVDKIKKGQHRRVKVRPKRQPQTDVNHTNIVECISCGWLRCIAVSSARVEGQSRFERNENATTGDKQVVSLST